MFPKKHEEILFLEANRGHEGFFSKIEKLLKDDEQVRVKAGIFRENDFERLFESNVEIFRRAFGDSHYLVTNSINEAQRGHKGYFSKDENHNEIMTLNPEQSD